MKLRHVRQVHKYGCACACLAMVTGKRYWEVIKAFRPFDFSKRGLTVSEAVSYLEQNGVKARPKYGGRWGLGELALLCVHTAAGLHMVVAKGGVVLDPDRPGWHRANATAYRRKHSQIVLGE